MRALLICLSVLVCLVLVQPAPQSRLQLTNTEDGRPYIEEVVVESVLHVRNPAGRQARTNTQTNLKDGARVAETKPKT